MFTRFDINSYLLITGSFRASMGLGFEVKRENQNVVNMCTLGKSNLLYFESSFYSPSSPALVSLTKNCVLKILQVEIDDDIIKECSSGEGLVILHGHQFAGYTLQVLRVLAQLL